MSETMSEENFKRLFVVIATNSEMPHSPEISLHETLEDAKKAKEGYLNSGFADGEDVSTDADGVICWVSIEDHDYISNRK